MNESYSLSPVPANGLICTGLGGVLFSLPEVVEDAVGVNISVTQGGVDGGPGPNTPEISIFPYNFTDINYCFNY